MPAYFFIRSANRCVKVRFADILYLEANRNYVRIVAQGKTHVIILSLRQLETLLPADIFCRVHRTYIVSLEHTVSFDHIHIYLQHERTPNKKPIAIPIGSQYRKLLKEKINIIAAETSGAYPASKLQLPSLTKERNN